MDIESVKAIPFIILFLMLIYNAKALAWRSANNNRYMRKNILSYQITYIIVNTWKLEIILVISVYRSTGDIIGIVMLKNFFIELAPSISAAS